MRLTILGGGGFRVPLVHRAPLGDRGEGRVTDVTLYDLDAYGTSPSSPTWAADVRAMESAAGRRRYPTKVGGGDLRSSEAQGKGRP